MDKQARFNIWFFLMGLFTLLMFEQMWTQWRTVETVPYSTFKTDLGKGLVNDIVVADTSITGHFKTPQNGKSEFITTRVEDPQLAQDLQKSGVQYTGAVASGGMRPLPGKATG